MRCTLLLLALTCLARFVKAYDIAGGYERLYFYYVYKLEVQLNKGSDEGGIWGGNCSRVFAKRPGTFCSLNEFLEYINDDSKATNFKVTDDADPDVRSTAARLDSMKLTGAMKLGHLRKTPDTESGLSGDAKYTNLLRRADNWLQLTIDSASDTHKVALFQAAEGSAIFRAQAKTKKMDDWLRNNDKGPKLHTVVYSAQRIFADLPTTVDLIDGRATADANADIGVSRESLRASIKTFGDGAHDGNIKVMVQSSENLTRVCAI